MRNATHLLLAVALLGSGCADPKINEYVVDHAGLITGTVIYRAADTGNPCSPPATTGNAIITLFREDAPPPPVGVSGPINFVVVPQAELFAQSSALGEGIFAAPFTMPAVPPGRYTVRGFLDADADFFPTIDLLGQPTAGDVGGAYVDPDTLEILTVEVVADQITSQVTVSLGLPIPVERPAFEVSSTSSITVPFATPPTLTLTSHPINTPNISMAPECTQFLVTYVDEDADGVPDDQNFDKLPDLYPRVILRKIETDPMAPTTIVPTSLNPFPFLDALNVAGAAVTDTLELLILPAAIEITAEGRTQLPVIPPGAYETVVVSGTGQTWQVPNSLALIEPAAPVDATQTEVINLVPGPALPGGSIEGVVRTSADAVGEGYVVAFAANNPPPPEGVGTPVGFVSIPAEAFQPAGTVRQAPFTLRGLPDGEFILAAIVDVDGDFSPLVDLVAQPSAGDYVGRAGPIALAGSATGVTVEAPTRLPFDRPAFEFEQTTVSLSDLPASVSVTAHPIAALGMSEESVLFPAQLTGADLDGDNLPDLYPRVLLTHMADGPDPRLAANDGPLIPAIVDPIPFIGALSSGAPLVPTDTLALIIPPVALLADGGGGFTRIVPPAGRYRINVLSGTGQTWSVPSPLDYQLGRVDGPLEDETQSRFFEIGEGAAPGGVITGQIQVLAALPPPPFQALVFVFDVNDPPPPLGAGRPVGFASVPDADFDPGGTADYAVAGLPSGTYNVRAFLDVNDDFVPWFDTMNQPNGGDIGGGHVQLPQGTFLSVAVDALGAPTAGITVSILDALTFPERPAFSLAGNGPIMSLSQGNFTTQIDTIAETSSLVSVDGTFAVQWVDVNGDGNADDVNGDGNPDVYPLVVADLLDPDDPTNQTLSSEGVRIPGFVSPVQFGPRGFPAADPTMTQVVVTADVMTVVFPPIASQNGGPVTPPAGRYRITLVSGGGQTWSLPNELQRAANTGFETTQGAYFTVQQ